jgi:hypothetical protein
LKKILGLPENVRLPTREHLQAHKNPPNVEKYLDPEGIENLKKWYDKDYAFLKLLKNKKLLKQPKNSVLDRQ